MSNITVFQVITIMLTCGGVFTSLFLFLNKVTYIYLLLKVLVGQGGCLRPGS